MTRSILLLLSLLFSTLCFAHERPADLIVSDDGQVIVTFDQGAQIGGLDAIAIYLGGHRVAQLAPEAFLTPEELERLPRCRCTANHRFWRQLFDASMVGHDLVLLRKDGSGAIVIGGEDGSVTPVSFDSSELSPPPTSS